MLTHGSCYLISAHRPQFTRHTGKEVKFMSAGRRKKTAAEAGVKTPKAKKTAAAPAAAAAAPATPKAAKAPRTKQAKKPSTAADAASTGGDSTGENKYSNAVVLEPVIDLSPPDQQQ